jgi:putative ABC transport system permease protein
VSARDVVAVGTTGLRARPLRAALSALGVAIGIAALVAVLGVSASSREGLLDRLDELGTDLLTVAPGQTFGGADAALPAEAAALVGRTDGVRRSAAVRVLDATVRRTDRIDPLETGGITVAAGDLDLPATLGARLLAGRPLTAATARGRAVVLGVVAAERLGVTRPGARLYLAGSWWTVVGVLEAMPLAPELDRAALVGFDAAARLLGEDRSPTVVYVRTDPEAVGRVRGLLPTAASPGAPEAVQVSRPSDALAARAAADDTLTGLLLGLGAVALLVGGVGIANTMVVAVLERRGEIGLRRALGATRGDVRTQFLVEAVLLAAAGGAAGVALGAAATTLGALAAGWQLVVPALAVGGGLLAAVLAGALAGLWPAARAARLAPAEALRAV